MSGTMQSMDNNIDLHRNLQLIRDPLKPSIYIINAFLQFNCSAIVQMIGHNAFNDSNVIQVIAGEIDLQEGCEFQGMSFFFIETWDVF